MIARKYLIPLRKEFLGIKNRGKFVNTPLFNLIITRNNFPYPRFAFIVSKKISLSSVVRHQIKRQLADQVSRLSLPANDYVFIVKKHGNYEVSNLVPH